jgi:hypothetical protein
MPWTMGFHSVMAVDKNPGLRGRYQDRTLRILPGNGTTQSRKRFQIWWPYEGYFTSSGSQRRLRMPQITQAARVVYGVDVALDTS